MISKNFKNIALIIVTYLLGACTPQKKVIQSPSKKKEVITKNVVKPLPIKPIEKLNLPSVKREFRAAWVATVANINWPSKGNFNTERQKAEALKILDVLKDANFNAVIFQARPSGDALYNSKHEPWSYFLTGKIGKAPSPYYDPLEFWIEEAHKRGMELHVWLNPYRAHHSSGGSVDSESIVHRLKESIYRLKNGMYWMDPSDDEVQNHASKVINDLVKNYDIDAVHIDDYFYPYKEYHGGADFPDFRTWNIYQKSGGTLSKADWRRANVNKFIKRIYDEIKAEKSYVKFGISPFGIWKPNYPQGIKGSSQYDELFADAKLWLNQGWCDYFSPQLYWKEGGAQSYSALLKWWNEENIKNIHLWPGLNTIAVKSNNRPSEILGQMNTNRVVLGSKTGEIHYSVDGVIKNQAMLSAIKTAYSEKALVPLSPWIKIEKILTPELSAKKQSNMIQVNFISRNPQQVRHWILFSKYGNQWQSDIYDASESNTSLPSQIAGKNLSKIALKAVDRLGNESHYTSIDIK